MPITTRTISHRLEMYPETTDECWFSSESLLYKPLASTYLLEDEDTKIAKILALKKREKLFLVDKENNILSYSLDEHFLLKKLSPRTSLTPKTNKITTLALVAD